MEIKQTEGRVKSTLSAETLPFKEALACSLMIKPFILFFLFMSIFTQVKICLNKCTISNAVRNTVIDAFPVVQYDVER